MENTNKEEIEFIDNSHIPVQCPKTLLVCESCENLSCSGQFTEKEEK